MRPVVVSVLPLVVALAPVQTQGPPFSKQYLPARAYSQEENEALVKKFHGLRVSDVADNGGGHDLLRRVNFPP